MSTPTIPRPQILGAGPGGAAPPERGAAPRRRPRRAGGIPRGMRRAVALSLLPGLALFGTFFLAPFAVMTATAFADWSGLHLDWTGLDNYRRLLGDPVFFKALGNTVFYAAASVLVQVPLGVAVGMLLALRPPAGRRSAPSSSSRS
nr:hypothetical protein GCM10025732_44930 [Glycomyces mayteni]